MPAPLAENVVLSLITAGESMTKMGTRFEPIKLDVIRTKTLIWFAAVILSRKILDTFWPVVPEEVIVLTISD